MAFSGETNLCLFVSLMSLTHIPSPWGTCPSPHPWPFDLSPWPSLTSPCMSLFWVQHEASQLTGCSKRGGQGCWKPLPSKEPNCFSLHLSCPSILPHVLWISSPSPFPSVSCKLSLYLPFVSFTLCPPLHLSVFGFKLISVPQSIHSVTIVAKPARTSVHMGSHLRNWPLCVVTSQWFAD